MNEAELIGIALAAGITIGAIAWDRLRGDLMPRLCNARHEAQLRELAERLARLEGRLATA